MTEDERNHYKLVDIFLSFLGGGSGREYVVFDQLYIFKYLNVFLPCIGFINIVPEGV